MLLTLCACKSRAGTAAREYALLMFVDVTQTLIVLRRLKKRLHVTGSVTSTALVNARPRTPASEDVIAAAVEWE
jgi:hypothetical protein